MRPAMIRSSGFPRRRLPHEVFMAARSAHPHGFGSFLRPFAKLQQAVAPRTRLPRTVAFFRHTSSFDESHTCLPICFGGEESIRMGS